MKIRKEYNIEQLAETLQQAIELSKKYDGIVKLDILTVHDILEVLKETHKREQKHQTLESALTFIEKEDGTQMNEVDLKNKVKGLKCFGYYDEGYIEFCMCDDEGKCMEMTNRFTELLQNRKGRLPECFGNYEEEDAWNDDCDECTCRVMCEMVEDRKKRNKTNE